MLAVATLILKAVGKYNDGDLTANSGYLYISVIYNISICLSLYCLAMFWMCVNEDLKPFRFVPHMSSDLPMFVLTPFILVRPMPKFLCVKGILFFSFWQSIFISILVAAGAIKHLGNTTDREHISVGLIDTLICFEMPIFAVAHMYAFAHTDYINTNIMYAARMPMYYALRDAFGLKDVIEDTKATLRGEGMDYREFEPAEGFIHQGSGRDRRIKAGLRYAQGGQKKYWLPMPADATESRGHRADVVHNVTQRAAGSDDEDEVYAPLLENQIADIVHDAPDMRSPVQEKSISERRGFELPFGDPDEEEETLYVHSKNYVFGDYHYPCIDASSEYARKQMWDEEERVLRDERGAFFSPIRQHVRGYGAVQAPGASNASTANTLGKGKARDGAEQVYVGTPRMIDRGADNIPDAGGDGLRLNWTKYDQPNTKTNIRPSSPHLSPQLRQVNISSVGASSPRASSSLSSSPRTHTLPHAQVRTDAVDLVVENESVAEAETVKERMRGEPAVRGSAWRKAYTRGYFHPEMKGEVADDEEEDTTAGDKGRKDVTSQAETRRSDEIVPDQRLADNSHPVETIIEEAGLEVARAATPPPHAQVGGIGQHSNMGGLHSHDYTINDENPWA